jgi:hypothetical protein
MKISLNGKKSLEEKEKSAKVSNEIGFRKYLILGVVHK